MENDKLVRLSDVTAAMNSEGYTKNMRVHKKVLSIPAVDAVKVCRCAECKYLNEDLAVGGWDGSCRFWNTHSVTYSWFCSQGQRREDGDA